jgi:deazaflavin-dependent oxidoreductase (nitroreductase family)
MPHDRIRAFNKQIFNRLIHAFAGAAHSPFALIRHVGRRSGKPYETPIIVRPMGDGIVIALTYGPEVDWYRNVLAAGQATLRWHGGTYTLDQPEPVERRAALPLFPAAARLILRLLGVQHFVRMKARSSAPTGRPTTA